MKKLFMFSCVLNAACYFYAEATSKLVDVVAYYSCLQIDLKYDAKENFTQSTAMLLDLSIGI